jgi:hypothetical protein
MDEVEKQMLINAVTALGAHQAWLAAELKDIKVKQKDTLDLMDNLINENETLLNTVMRSIELMGDE